MGQRHGPPASRPHTRPRSSSAGRCSSGTRNPSRRSNTTSRSAGSSDASALVLTDVRRNADPHPALRRPHQHPSDTVRRGRPVPRAARQRSEDGTLTVPQGSGTRAHRTVQPPRRAPGRVRADPDRRHHRACGAASPAGHGPSPVEGIEVTKPAWPLLWVDPIENWVGVVGILWATIAIFAALLVVPFVDRSEE